MAHIPLRLSKMERSVRCQISRELVETGDQRSPKKAPAKIAPPTSMGLSPMVLAMVIHTTPMVAAVPKEVPVSTDTPQLSKKLSR